MKKFKKFAAFALAAATAMSAVCAYAEEAVDSDDFIDESHATKIIMNDEFLTDSQDFLSDETIG